MSRFMLQNGNLLELDVNIINKETVDIKQISYDKKGVVEEHGSIIISKWALERIMIAIKDNAKHRNHAEEEEHE